MFQSKNKVTVESSTSNIPTSHSTSTHCVTCRNNYQTQENIFKNGKLRATCTIDQLDYGKINGIASLLL